jgi:hypothetical protein
MRTEDDWLVWCKVNAKKEKKSKQVFRELGRCIFTGKCNNEAESDGGRHVVRARGWWRREDVSACAAGAQMQCWVHDNFMVDDIAIYQQLRGLGA